jgi:hypothetical protein
MVKGYEGIYKVSNLGRIKSMTRLSDANMCISEKILNPWFHKKGYLSVGLSKQKKVKTHFVHRLVAEAFLCKKESSDQVNHIDGKKANNDTNNLEWCSASENIQHSYDKLGRRTNSEWMKLHNPMSGQTGDLCQNSKRAYQYAMTGEFLKEWGSCEEAERELGVKHVSCACRGDRRQVGGFLWSYEKKDRMEIRARKPKARKVR